MNVDNKPVIGISVGTSRHWRRSGRYFRSYAAPVEAAGGICVPIGEYAGKKLDRCDGLLVPGGWDIHPGLYMRLPGDEALSAAEVMSRYGVQCESRRDELELEFIRQAIEEDKPILAICRGFQALNVVLAGKLIPDIPSYLNDPLKHRSPGIGVSLSHEVNVEVDSIIGRAYGSRRVVVNTRHHQGLTREMVSEKLRVTGMAPDGIVEAIEGKDSRFLVGVQWHPERQKDEFIHSISKPLFEAFINACI